jgi:hypothetical protein
VRSFPNPFQETVHFKSNGQIGGAKSFFLEEVGAKSMSYNFPIVLEKKPTIITLSLAA